MKKGELLKKITCIVIMVPMLTAGFTAALGQPFDENGQRNGDSVPKNGVIGDWIVPDVQSRSNEIYTLTGNLLVKNGGSLTLTNVTLQMDCTSNGQYRIEVEAGGELYIYDGDNDPSTTEDGSTITAVDPAYHYLFWVDDGATLVMKNSEIQSCGYNNWGDIRNLGLWVNGGNITLDGNLISENYVGVYIAEAEQCTIINNTIQDNDNGLYLANCEEITGTTTTFSNGAFSKTIHFPLGGGYNHSASVTLPGNAMVIDASLRITIPPSLQAKNSVGPPTQPWEGSGERKKRPSADSSVYNVTLDVGDDGDREWSQPGKFIKTAIVCGVDVVTELNLLLNTKGGMQSDVCIPLNLTATSSGKIQLTNLHITWVKPMYDIVANMIVGNAEYGVFCAGGAQVLRSCLVMNPDIDLSLGDSLSLTTLNSMFNKSKVEFRDLLSQLSVTWFMGFAALYRNWTVVTNASVTVKDASDAVMFTDVTDGNPMPIRCVEYNQTSAGKTMYTPHNITVVYDGLTWYTDTEPTMDQPQSVQVTISMLDLQVTSLQFSHDIPLVNSPVTITATIYNDGYKNAPGFTVRFLDNGVQIGSDQLVPSLPAWSSTQIPMLWTTPPTSGYHIINVSIDPNDEVNEDDETNNIPGEGIGVYEDMNGDWIVSDVLTKNDSYIILNGNLLVTSTGNLSFTNGALRINSTYDGQYGINVETNGVFIARTSDITAHNPIYHYRFEVYGTLCANQVQFSDLWGNPDAGGLQIYPQEVEAETTIFSDDFNDGSISDWSIDAVGGTFAISSLTFTSPPYSVHMQSTGTGRATGTSPSYSLDISSDYTVSFNFMIPQTDNHWFEVFANYHVYLVIDSYNELSWYDGTPAHLIMYLTPNQWYHIDVKVSPSSNYYDVYVDGQPMATYCSFFVNPLWEYNFRIGDRADEWYDRGEAYWDDFFINASSTTMRTDSQILYSTITNSESYDLYLPSYSYPAVAETLYDHDKVLLGSIFDDTDGDFLSNGEELYIYGTDFNSTDTDEDGWNDYDEKEYWIGRVDTETAGQYACDADADDDLMIDYEEWSNDLDPLLDDAYMHYDGDGIPLKPQVLGNR